MTGVVIHHRADADIQVPPADKSTIGFDADGKLSTKNSAEVVTKYSTTADTHFPVTLTQDTAVNLCVNFAGAFPDVESTILGVCEAAALNTEIVNVRFSGVANVVLGVDGAIVVGDKITTDANGKVKKATGGMTVIGRALIAGDTTNDIIKIKLTT